MKRCDNVILAFLCFDKDIIYVDPRGCGAISGFP